MRSHGILFLLSFSFTRAGQSRSGHTAASSIGRAPGSDPGEVGSIPAAAASRAMRRGFFSLLSQTGWGPGSSHPGLPCPVRAKPAARLWYISSPSFFRIWPGGVVRPSAWAHSQQCEQMVARPPGTRVSRKGLEVRVLSAAPQGGFDSRSCQRGPVRRERGSILCAGVWGNNPGLALVRQCCRRPAG